MMTRTGIHMPTTLIFVESEDDYSVYRTRDGKEVYLAHGTGKRMVAFDELDLSSLWQEYKASAEYFASYQHGFRAMLAGLTIEPEVVDDVGFCADCSVPDHEDELRPTNGDAVVCEPCLDNYYPCGGCEERYRNTTTVDNDTEVCEHCLDEHYSYCDSCEHWYYTENGGHDHDEGNGCCESPAQSFIVRNDGEPPLTNDTRVTVTLPAGVISTEGIGAIAAYLRNWSRNNLDGVEMEKLYQLSFRLTELGDKWQTKDGNYTKRLSRFAYKTFGLKVVPEVVSRIGCIARDHSTAVDFQIETTRNLNQSAAEFGHEESCWWQSYYSSRCTLKSNGGFGLRTFTENGWVSGRSWVMPLRQTDNGTLIPTFETLEPDAFVVFNGYGSLSGYVPARIVSHMAGMTYRKVAFSCDPMYVNSDSGYLVAPEEIASKYTDGILSLHVEQHSTLHADEQRTIPCNHFEPCNHTTEELANA